MIVSVPRYQMLLAIVIASALVAGGCSGSDDDGASADEFDGVSITVGSKNFTEQYVLSEILIQALEARGADVVDATDTGDTATTRAALEGGDIDGYWEYNSTGWVEHLGNSDPDPEGEALTDAVRAADESNGIRWLGRTGFNDTYGFAVAPLVRQDNLSTRANNAEAFDLAAMADYLDENSDAVVCVEPEFQGRSDGLVLFEAATGFTIPADRLMVFDDEADIYEAVADGDCDFGEIFTTDGRLESLDLSVVIDPGVFYVYNASFTVRDEIYQQAPEAFDRLVEDIISPLTQDRITDLNRRVAEGEPVAEVAEDYLETFEINPSR